MSIKSYKSLSILCLAALLANSGIMAPFVVVPILAERIGLSYDVLGVIGFAYGISCFISYYVFGRLSDNLGKRKIFIIIGFFISGVVIALHIYANDAIRLMILRALFGFSVGIFSFPLVAYVHDVFGNRGVSIVSAFSSFGWAVGGFMISVVKDIYTSFEVSSILFFVAFILMLKLKDSNVKALSVPIFPVKVIRKNSILYISYFLRHLGACSIWIIFPIYLISLGADLFVLGILYAINPIVQTITMLLIPRLSIDTKILIRTGLSLSLLTFTIYALSVKYTTVIPAQLTLGIAWATLYVGSLLYLLNRNVEKSTSTGLLGSVMSLSNMFGALIGGFLAVYSLKAPIVFACLLCTISLVISSKL